MSFWVAISSIRAGVVGYFSLFQSLSSWAFGSLFLLSKQSSLVFWSVSFYYFLSFWVAISSVEAEFVAFFFCLFQSVSSWAFGLAFSTFHFFCQGRYRWVLFASVFRIQPQVITVVALSPSLSWLPYDIFVEFLLVSCFLSISQRKVYSCADV